MKMKRRMTAIILAGMLVVLSACSTTAKDQGNDGARNEATVIMQQENNVVMAYNEAMNLMIQGKYGEAAEKLAGITYYQDSVQLSRYCRAQALAAEGKYADAISELEKLGSFRDAPQSAAYFSARLAEENAGSSPTFRVYAADMYDVNEISGYRDSEARAAKIRLELYQEGLKAEEEARWARAAECYDALGNYSESRIRFLYTTGRMFEAEGETQGISYANAAMYLHNAGDYRDAADRKQQCLEKAFAKADQLIREEDFAGARKIYTAMGDLCDADKFKKLEEAVRAAEERARQTRIAEADVLMEQEKFDEARKIYTECNELEKAKEAVYQKAAWLDRNGQPASAAKIYMDITDYKDSREKHYLLGKTRMESDPETASSILLEDRGYPEAADDLYMIARAASDAKNYPLSIAIYSEFSGEKDCTLRMMNDLYLYGRKLLEENNPEQAAQVFDMLKGVGSADLYAQMARYAAADALETQGKYETAADAFDLIAGYEDAADRADECRYKLALEKKKNGDYAEAAKVFAKLGNKKDSMEQEKDCRYLLAGKNADDMRWEDAISLYEALGDYSDSKARCLECYRRLGWKKLEAGESEAAYNLFVSAGDEEGQARAAFDTGEKYTAIMNLDRALKWYGLAASLPETEERTAMVAQSLLDMEEDSLSESYASVVANSEKSQAVLYALALRSLERKDEEAALRQMKKAGDNSDASERFQEMLSARVEALIAQDQLDDAIFLCSTYGNREKAEEIRALKAEEERRKVEEAEKAAYETRLKAADDMLNAGKYEEAAALYSEIGENELAESALAKKLETEEAIRLAEEAAKAKLEAAELEKYRAREEEAAGLLAAGRYDEAISIYEELNDGEMVNEIIYRKAAALNQPELYLEIPEYKDSRELHYQAGKALLDSDPEKAFTILAEDMTYADVQTVLYDLAGKASENENYLLSSSIYEKLGTQPLDPGNPMADCLMLSVQEMYRYGIQLKEQGDWETATVIFNQLDGIGKAAERLSESYYAIAASLEESGKYSQAAVSFESLGDYRDAAERSKQNRYNAAVKMMESGDYENAEKALAELSRYSSEAAETLMECRYRKATGLMNRGKYEEAGQIFAVLGDYAESAENNRKCIYQIAEQMMAGAEYLKAIGVYETLGDYQDASEKILACHTAIAEQYIAEAEAFLKNRKTDRAAESYQSAYREYEKAGNTEKTESLATLVAECYQSVGDLNKALEWYRRAGNAGKSRIAEIAEYCFRTEQDSIAETIAVEAGTEEAKAILFQLSVKKRAEGDDAAELRLLEEAGDYQDAVSRLEDIKMLRAEEMIEAGKFAEAEAIAGQLSETSGRKLIYRLAEKQLSAGNEDEALRLFSADRDYADSEDRYNEILYQRALRQMEDGQYIAAGETLDQIPEYKDAAGKKKEALYGLALSGGDDKDSDAVRNARLTYVEDKIEEADYDAAILMLESMNQDKLIMEKLQSTRFSRAEKREAAGDYEGAVEDYTAVGAYSDAPERILRLRYQQAMLCKAAEDYDGAIGYLNIIPDYEDAAEQIRECTYLKAGKLVSEGDQAGAVGLYQDIIDYRDVRKILADGETVPEGLGEWRASLVPGNIVHFGSGEDAELGWIVLDNEEGNLLLIAENSSEYRAFDTGTRVSWQHSAIRKYLNGEFISSHFSDAEEAAIQMTFVKAEKGSLSKSSPGNNTEDKVFLISEQEFNKYQEIFLQYPGSSDWWTRTPGNAGNNICVVHVYPDGKKSSIQSVAANSEKITIRPLLWVNASIIIH